MTIIRWNTLPGLESNFNRDYLRNRDASFAPAAKPQTNISKLEDHFILEMAVPGLTREEIEIKAEPKVLEISFEPQSAEEENSSEVYLRREFEKTAFRRKFTLPEYCDIERISAKYENGILTVNVPFDDPEKNKVQRSIQVN